MFPHAPGIIYGRSPPSPLAIELNNRYYPKNQSTHEDDRTQAIYEHGRSGKLERSIAPNPRAIDSKPKLNYIEIEQIFKERG
ncbi:hypothetical protein [Microcoleus sp. D2_18a_B4]|uniref:hypothetical protein n=1 Tax=Microcoleus sp. D2_18a_B4 TaxID=3055329 RepID=UPI002FD39B83